MDQAPQPAPSLPWIQRAARTTGALLEWLVEALTLSWTRERTWRQRLWGWTWLGGIFTFVLMVWAVFLNLGRIPFGIPDWGQEWAFDTVLQQALRQIVLPLHTSSITYGTDRFLAIPQTILSPQVFLLRFVSIDTFLLIQAVLLLAAGFIGCILLVRELRLSAFAGGVLILLFTLNGHLIAQVAVGHVMWLGLLLIPFFLHLMVRLVEGRAGARWPLAMGLTLFAVLLQGSIHVYVWALLFLGLVWAFDSRHRRALVLASLLSGFLGAFRLIPAGLAFAEASSTTYVGYPSLAHLVVGLVFPLPPSESLWLTTAAGWWEYDMYVGAVGFVFLAVFGLILPGRRAWAGRASLVFAAGVLGLFSLGYLYYPVRFLGLPLVSHERVFSRFLALPLLVVFVIAVESFQRWLDRSPLDGGRRLLLLGLFLVGLQDLVQHARMWRLTQVAQALTPKAVDLSLHIANRPDPAYAQVLVVSAAISAAGLIAVLVRAVRPRRG